MSVVIVDYKMGNLFSIKNMLSKLGTTAVVSSSLKDISSAEKLILPGVGAFDTAVSNLRTLDLIPTLNKKVLSEKTPVLGICLGMQLFSKKSEEGKLPGLGWINGETVKFNFGEKSTLKIPHMGWNAVIPHKKSSIFKNSDDEQRFYFVHSYHVICKDCADVLATTNHGFDFVSALNHKNIYGVQFHPEKSHKFGMRLLRNFLEL